MLTGDDDAVTRAKRRKACLCFEASMDIGQHARLRLMAAEHAGDDRSRLMGGQCCACRDALRQTNDGAPQGTHTCDGLGAVEQQGLIGRRGDGGSNRQSCGGDWQALSRVSGVGCRNNLAGEWQWLPSDGR